MSIILAEEKHLHEINEITNYYIINTNFNFNIQPKTIEESKMWFKSHIKKELPIIVYIDNDEKVLGWASLSIFRDYRGYDKTVEISLYVHNEYQGKGIGSSLILEIEKIAVQKGFHSIISAIASENIQSINLHKKFGYEIQGKFKEIGYKNNKFLDVVFLYKII